MKTTKAGVFAITLLPLVLAALAGCGGGGGSTSSGGGGGTTPNPTLSIDGYSTNPPTVTITLGQPVPFVIATGNATSCASSGNLSGSVNGAIPCNGTTTITPIAVGSYTFTVAATNTAESVFLSVTVVVNPVPITVTSVVPTCNPSSILTGGMATCTAVVNGTGNPGQSVTWSVNGPATMTQAGVVTSTGATGTITAIATSTVNTNVFGSAVITVTAPLPTVTISANPTTVSSGNSTTLTINAANATTCTVPGLSGTSCNIVETVFPTVTTTYTVTATGPGGSTTASVTVTVTAAVPSISVACNPNTTTTVGSIQCTATYQNLPSGVAWSVTGASTCGVTASGVVTSSVAGTCSVTATSLQAGYTNVSGSATVTVTEAIPVITGSNLPYLYADGVPGILGGIQLNGSGFQTGDVISANPNIISGSQLVNSGQITLVIALDTPHTSPGWLVFTVTTADGLHSTSYSIPFTGGNSDLLGLSSAGELFFSDMAQGLPSGQNGYIRKYKSDGTPDGSFMEPSFTIAVDNKSGNVILGAGDYDENGNNNDVSEPQSFPSGQVLDEAATNGYGVFVQPNNNSVSSYALTTGGFGIVPVQTITVGNQPACVATGSFGSETDAFGFSRNDTILWKINVSGGLVITNSQLIPGITPYTTLQASNPLAGGCHVVVSDSGPASGTVAVLSTADNLLTFLNTSTLAITKQITLTGIPFRMAKDLTHGTVIVALVDQANVRTSFISVNETTGVVTQLTSVTPTGLLAVGLQVSTDGSMIDACQRSQCVILPNH